ncbi:MAG TPA: hypothetical protein VH741_01555 [Candidatus Limnocylindrales bacterium]|jgi:hypothetical protein
MNAAVPVRSRTIVENFAHQVALLRRAVSTGWFRGQLGPSRETEWRHFSPRPR